uniref:Peptidase S1 domain-containing protein n=1 Tax=Otolemur garnettii TaxID=30611 RepID=H0XSF5_OTOGA
MGGSGAGHPSQGRRGACTLATALLCLRILPLHAQPTTPSVSADFPPVKSLRAEVVSTVCGKSTAIGGSHGKIYHGQKAEPGRWPWQASLLLYGRHICGAALIDSTWVACAAHCFQRSKSPSDYRILLGYNQLSRPTEYSRQMTVNKLFVHKDFGRLYYMSRDITLLQLHRSVEFNDYIRPACLPPANINVSMNATCYVTGWGMITEDTFLSEPLELQEGEVGLIESQYCEGFFQPPDSGTLFGIREDMLCAGDFINSKSICRGDSGGPLVCWVNNTWFLMGLASWSMPCSPPIGPSVFARVSYFLNWIDEKKKEADEPEVAHIPPEEKPTAVVSIPSLGTVHRPSMSMALVLPQTLLLLVGLLQSL